MRHEFAWVICAFQIACTARALEPETPVLPGVGALCGVNDNAVLFRGTGESPASLALIDAAGLFVEHEGLFAPVGDLSDQVIACRDWNVDLDSNECAVVNRFGNVRRIEIPIGNRGSARWVASDGTVYLSWGGTIISPSGKVTKQSEWDFRCVEDDWVLGQRLLSEGTGLGFIWTRAQDGAQVEIDTEGLRSLATTPWAVPSPSSCSVFVAANRIGRIRPGSPTVEYERTTDVNAFSGQAEKDGLIQLQLGDEIGRGEVTLYDQSFEQVGRVPAPPSGYQIITDDRIVYWVDNAQATPRRLRMSRDLGATWKEIGTLDARDYCLNRTGSQSGIVCGSHDTDVYTFYRADAAPRRVLSVYAVHRNGQCIIEASESGRLRVVNVVTEEAIEVGPEHTQVGSGVNWTWWYRRD